MNFLISISIVLFILTGLSVFVIYLNSIGVKIKGSISAIWFFFVLCLIGGTTLYSIGTKSLLGLLYASYLLLLSGGISAITVFVAETGLAKVTSKATLWTLFLLCTLLGAISIIIARNPDIIT